MAKKKNITKAFENLFDNINSRFNIRIATFLSSREKSVFDEHLLSKFNEPFPIPFDGIVQSSYDEDETGKFDNSDSLKIKANNLRELLTTFVDASNEYYADDWNGSRLRIHHIKYVTDGNIMIYLREYENDCLDDYHSIFYNALIKEEYSVLNSSHNFIYFDEDLTGVNLFNTFEPFLFVISFLKNVDLSQMGIKYHVENFSSELNTLGYYPAKLSNDEYTFIFFDDNHFGLIEDLGDDEPFSILGECLMNLFALRKKITYSITEKDTIQHLFKIININEQNSNGNDFKLKDYMTHSFEEFIAKLYFPSATYNGNDIHFMVIENGNGIGDIILWNYEITGSEVTIEYSLRLLTDNLIIEFK